MTALLARPLPNQRSRQKQDPELETLEVLSVLATTSGRPAAAVKSPEGQFTVISLQRVSPTTERIQSSVWGRSVR